MVAALKATGSGAVAKAVGQWRGPGHCRGPPPSGLARSPRRPEMAGLADRANALRHAVAIVENAGADDRSSHNYGRLRHQNRRLRTTSNWWIAQSHPLSGFAGRRG